MIKTLKIDLFVRLVITWCMVIFCADAQNFQIDDKLPVPIPIGSDKPVKGLSEAAFLDGMKLYMIEEYAKALSIFEKGIRNEEKNSGLAFQISATYQKLNNIDKAIEFSKKAYELDKTNMEYGQMYGGLLAKNGKFDEASQIYKKLFEADPTNSEIGLDLAATYYSQNKFDEVLKIYSTIEKNLGPSQELSNQKQRIYLRLNKVKEAIAEGEKLINSDPNEIENYIDQAELLIRNDKEVEAIKYIDKALQLNPESGQAHILLADIARRKKDINKMFEELNLAFADKNLESNTLTKVLFNFLELLPPDSDATQKEKLVKKIIENYPEEPKGYLLMADLLYQAGKKKEANGAYLKAVKLEKNNNQIWMRILAIDYELADYQLAIKHAEDAIELYPNQALFWYYDGAANFMLNQHEKATEPLEEAKRLAGEEKELNIIINTLLGEAYNRLAKHDKSDEAYETVLKLDPNNYGVANNYSYYLALRKEKVAYAIEIAAKLIARNPTNGTYLDTYGWTLYVAKQYEKAKEYLEKAYQQNEGKSAVITEHFGDALYKLGEKEKALDLWKKAATKDPKNRELEKKITEGKIIE